MRFGLDKQEVRLLHSRPLHDAKTQRVASAAIAIRRSPSDSQAVTRAQRKAGV